MAEMKPFDVFFVAALSFLTICMASWYADENSEKVYQWMMVEFNAIILFRILVIVEYAISSRIRLHFHCQHFHLRPRLVALYGLHMILCPFLWIWNALGFLCWFVSTEYHWLPPAPGVELEGCFFVFLVLSFYELFHFACSSVRKHLEADRLPPCKEHGHQSSQSGL